MEPVPGAKVPAQAEVWEDADTEKDAEGMSEDLTQKKNKFLGKQCQDQEDQDI